MPEEATTTTIPEGEEESLTRSGEEEKKRESWLYFLYYRYQLVRENCSDIVESKIFFHFYDLLIIEN